jgi:hypothetical protein
MDRVINLQFTPVQKDYVRATRVLARKSPGFITMAIILFIAIIAAAIVKFVPGVGQPSWDNIAVAVLIVGAFYILYFLAIVPLQFSKNYKQNEYLKMERNFTISDEQMIMTVGDRTSTFDWENFQKVIDGGDFFLMIYKAQQRVYPFIPKHAFEEESAFQAYLDLLAEKSIPVK